MLLILTLDWVSFQFFGQYMFEFADEDFEYIGDHHYPGPEDISIG
jgi:hypothetical protein